MLGAMQFIYYTNRSITMKADLNHYMLSGACPGGGGAKPPLEIEKPKKKGHQSKF